MKLNELFAQTLQEQKPPKDMFEKGSAQQIVGWIRDQHEDAEKAIQVLNFWIMKQGKKLEPNRVKVLDFAKELLHKEFGNEGKLDGKLEESNMESELADLRVSAKTDTDTDFIRKFYNLYKCNIMHWGTTEELKDLKRLVAMGAKIKVLFGSDSNRSHDFNALVDRFEDTKYVLLAKNINSKTQEAVLYKK